MKSAALLILLAACGGSDSGDSVDAPGTPGADADTTTDASPFDAPAGALTVFVIPMENKATAVIYGNETDAPYINGLFATAARSTNFGDALPTLPSEPHYVFMEAGTNRFTDRTFINDADPSATNSTSNPDHLVTQLTAAGIPWMTYQEGIAAGTCPIRSTGHYAAKHDPFVFFQDVVGSPPSAANAACAAHHKPYSAFEADLAAGLTGYVYITPDECHDMHGASSCPSGTGASANIKAGDTWLSTELPRILAYAETHEAIVLLTWDEGDSSNLIPFLALGSHVKPNTATATKYTHRSLLKTTEKLFGVPVLASVADANDFADMFEPGTF